MAGFQNYLSFTNSVAKWWYISGNFPKIPAIFQKSPGEIPTFSGNVQPFCNPRLNFQWFFINVFPSFLSVCAIYANYLLYKECNWYYVVIFLVDNVAYMLIFSYVIGVSFQKSLIEMLKRYDVI